MSELDRLIAKADEERLVVTDMVTNLFGQIRNHARSGYRHAVRKRFSVAQPSDLDGVITRASGINLQSALNDNPHTGERSLFPEVDQQELEEVARVVGDLSVGSIKPWAYDHFMDRRSLSYEGQPISVNNFVGRVWAPEYAAGMLAAMYGLEAVEAII